VVYGSLWDPKTNTKIVCLWLDKLGETFPSGDAIIAFRGIKKSSPLTCGALNVARTGGRI